MLLLEPQKQRVNQLRHHHIIARLLHTHNSPSVETNNLDVIYSDDDYYECVDDQGEGAEATPIRSEDFGLTRNDSYDVINEETLYEEP